MKTAIVFTGQGSQLPLMGKDIVLQYPQFVRFWECAEEYSKLPIRKIFWEDLDEAVMMQTNVAQPALLCMALMLYEVHKEQLSPDVFSGHSLGEYCALAVNGFYSYENAIRIVAKRGLYMHNADTEGVGGMLAVLKLPYDLVQAIVTEVAHTTGALLVIANYNSPLQFIVSGEKRAFPLLIEAVKKHKGRAMQLSVSGAFHSPLLNEAERAFIDAIRTIPYATPTQPIYSNVTGSALSTPESIFEAMCKQMTSPVQWTSLVQTMYDDGVRHFIEIGVKPILVPLIKASLSPELEGTYTLQNITTIHT